MDTSKLVKVFFFFFQELRAGSKVTAEQKRNHTHWYEIMKKRNKALNIPQSCILLFFFTSTSPLAIFPDEYDSECETRRCCALSHMELQQSDAERG